MPGPLLVADLPWLLYRSFYAIPEKVTDDDGRPVNALLGTVNALLGAVEAVAPRAVVPCTGPESALYRVEAFPAYHAHRPPMPDGLAEQWVRAPALLRELGWEVACTPDHEADDLMYSLAVIEAEAGGEAMILSGDRDMYGAVRDGVAVLEMKAKGPPVFVDVAEVRRRYGIGPELVPDFIALRGDPSDGIPGAPGIGEKTARDLLREHGSLEDVVGAAARQRPRLAAALRDSAESLRMFREIATLQRLDVARPIDRATDYRRGTQAARDLGMNALAGRLERRATRSDG